MLKLRLRRTGQKKQPSYRVVVTEHTAARDGAFIENLGYYNPLTDPATVEINAERVQYWLSVGAQPTETVHRLLAGKGLLPPLPRKTRGGQPPAEQPTASTAAGDAAAGQTQAATGSEG